MNPNPPNRGDEGEARVEEVATLWRRTKKLEDADTWHAFDVLHGSKADEEHIRSDPTRYEVQDFIPESTHRSHLEELEKQLAQERERAGFAEEELRLVTQQATDEIRKRQAAEKQRDEAEERAAESESKYLAENQNWHSLYTDLENARIARDKAVAARDEALAQRKQFADEAARLKVVKEIFEARATQAEAALEELASELEARASAADQEADQADKYSWPRKVHLLARRDALREAASLIRNQSDRERKTMNGIDLIRAERERQVAEEGWEDVHDDDHDGGEMASAAACYAIPVEYRRLQPTQIGPPVEWPWEAKWWKPSPTDRVRELVKAGALIAAEIDRLQRQSDRESDTG